MKNQLELQKMMQEVFKTQEAKVTTRIEELEELLAEKFNKGFNQTKN